MNFYGGNKSKGDILVIFGAKIEMHFKNAILLSPPAVARFTRLLLNFLIQFSIFSTFYFLFLS